MIYCFSYIYRLLKKYVNYFKVIGLIGLNVKVIVCVDELMG